MVGFHLGPSTALSNRQIRKMLRLARASSKDIFYDLGSGAGQLCIMAVKEFGVKSAVGIDSHKGRVKKARKNIRKLGLEAKIKIRYERIEEADFTDATIVYCGLMEEEDTLEKYEKTLKKNCRLVTPFLPLISIIPNKENYPFYLMRFPFRKTRNADVWASSVLLKKGTLSELISEVKKDPEWSTDISSMKKFSRLRFL